MLSTEDTIPLESFPDAIAITDARGCILKVNAHTEALLGYDRSEIVGQPIEMVISERFREEYAVLRHSYDNLPPVRQASEGIALSIRHKDGREVAVEIMLSPAALGLIITVLRDISKRRELERFRDEYLGFISHDLKNPLSIIMLESRLLAQNLALQGLSDVRHAVEVIAQSAAFVDRMVRELLEMSYLESERVELQHEATELAGFLKDVLERTVSTADRGRVRLEIRDSVTAWVDRTRLERVVVNFVQNALKYAAKDSPIVVRLERHSDMAKISVVDEGPGLTAEEASFVFDKYRRTRSTGKREGLGLGLYISRKIVEAHGGQIGVDSVPNKGSTFYLQIPLTEREAKQVVIPIDLQPTAEDCRARLRGAHVLIVDDEVNAVSALGLLLAEDGLVAATATSGAQALVLSATKRFDAVVLDVEMPYMNGLSLLQQLRAWYPDIPAVFMTGYLMHHAGIAQAREATGAAYIGKPVDVDELIQVLARLVKRRPEPPAN